MPNDPDPTHSHYDTETNRFVEHTHDHEGPHLHGEVNIGGLTFLSTIPGPGNYSPHGLEGRGDAQATEATQASGRSSRSLQADRQGPVS